MSSGAFRLTDIEPPARGKFSAGDIDKSPGVVDRANELAGKFLSGAGLPTSISDIPNWFQHFVGAAKDSKPAWEAFKTAVEHPTQENIVNAVPFFGPTSVAMSKDVRKGDYSGAAVDAAATLAPALVGKAPQMAEGLTGVGEAIHNAPSAVKNAIGTALRDELNKMKPGVKATTALGKLVGIPELADALIPDRPGAASLAERRAIPITKSPNFDPAAFKSGAAERTTAPPEEIPQGKPSPFGNATASNSPSLPTTPVSGFKALQVPDVKIVSKFEAPSQSVIASPLSPPPPINKTLVSYDRNLLVHMARGGDLNALRELIRNPGGIDVASAVPNSKFLMETGRPTNIYGGPK